MADSLSPHDSNFYHFDDYSFYYSPAGASNRPKDWPKEAHDQVEILVLLEPTSQTEPACEPVYSAGKIRWQAADSSHHCASLFPGQACIIPPQQWHRLSLTRPAEALLILLETHFIVRVTHETLRMPCWQLPGDYAVIDETISFVAKALRGCLVNRHAIAALYRKNLVRLLAVHLIAKYAQADLQPAGHESPVISSQLAPVLQHIHSNLEQDLKVSDLADLAELSQSHFCRVFKKAVGLAPYRYILSQRIALAKKLLSTTALGLADISFQCGFYDQSHFILQFRRFTGTTPKAYRENAARAG